MGLTDGQRSAAEHSSEAERSVTELTDRRREMSNDRVSAHGAHRQSGAQRMGHAARAWESRAQRMGHGGGAGAGHA